MTSLEAERQLVLFLAGVLELVPDREIFADALPDALPEGVWVRFEQGHPATLTRPNKFTAGVRGRFRSRSECAERADAVTSALPVFGVGDILSIQVGGEVQTASSRPEENAIPCFEFSIPLTVDFI